MFNPLKSTLIFFLFSILFFGLSCARVVYKTNLFFGDEEANWVKKIMSKMTIEEKIGQLVTCPYDGNFVNSDSDYLKDLESLITKWKIGGLILFGGEVYEAAHLTNTLQKMAQIPLLISSDFERGVANQITGATLFPPLMALGATDSEELAYFMGKITAIEARAIGIHMTYAPVADVNNNPSNPIINTRSFGEDPEHVSQLSLAFVKGCQENGLLATAKHFPGHGDTDVDSHTLLPVISGERSRLEKIELYPFEQAIKGGVKAIMTAHIYVPTLDPTPNLPATLSPLILTNLLRKELGFQGLIVTDAMTMGGITSSYSPQEAAIKTVQAGADVILMPPNPGAVIKALIQAVSSGQIPEERINASVKRILEAKASLNLHKNRMVEIDALAHKISSKENLQQAARIFENSMTLIKNEENIVPLSSSNLKIAVFSLSSDPGDYFAGRIFVKELTRRCPDLISFYADPYTGQEYIEEGVAKAKEADVVIFALFSSLRAGKGSVDVDQKHIQIIKRFSEGPMKVVAVSFGSPYFLLNFPEVDSYLCAYRYAPQAQEAAAKAIFGEIDIQGKIPVSLPGLYPLGYGLISKKK